MVESTSTAQPMRWELPPGLLKLLAFGMLAGLLPGIALGTGIGLSIGARVSSVPLSAPAPTAISAANGELQPDVPLATTLKDAPAYARLGQDDAPVKLVIFEDPRCGYCKQLANGAEKTLIDRYVNTGQLQLISRSFDILGPESKQMSIAAACAGRAGKYWAFRDQVFAESQAAAETVDAQIGAWAKAAGVADLDAFKRCQTSAETLAIVDADNASGAALGIRGTPTLFFNGRRIVGAVPLQMLEDAIREAQRAKGA